MKRGEIARMILGAVGIAGIVVIAIAAPNALQILGVAQKRKSRYAKRPLDDSLRNLKRRRFLRFVRGRRGWRIELTEKGLQELAYYELHEKFLHRPKRWDGMWHILIFDIQETRRLTRDAIRRTLILFGFYRLQDSVWVFPYPCEEILELLRTKYRVRHDALYIAAKYISNDRALREHFQLRK